MCIIKHGCSQKIPARPDPEAPHRRSSRQSGRSAPPAHSHRRARHPSYPLARPPRAAPRQDGRWLQASRRRQSRRSIASSRAGPRTEGILARYPPRAEYARPQNSSRRRATSRRRGGFRTLARSCRHSGRRRHRPYHHAVAHGSRRHPETRGGNAAMTDPLRGAGVRCLTELYPQLRGWGEAPCKPLSVEAIASSGAQVVFLSTPHEASLELVPALLAANPALRIVDLSGAYRFRSPETFAHWYKLAAPDSATLAAAVYGLPELYADALPAARLVANPGCYPTSVILGLRPLVEAGWINAARGIVCDCKSGVSGAGKEPKRETHFVEVNENFRAYGLFTHRHTPEIIEHSGVTSENFIFTTHLLPVERGILSTLYMWLNPARRADEIVALYRQFFAMRPLVRILPHGRLPELQHVTHTNFCDIGFALDPAGERLVVVSCLDNLGKGAAGQAVQNMNRMWGYPETAGLL